MHRACARGELSIKYLILPSSRLPKRSREMNASSWKRTGPTDRAALEPCSRLNLKGLAEPFGLGTDTVASVVTSKPAMRGRLKTGHVEWPKTVVVLPCRSGLWQGRIRFRSDVLS